MKLDQKGHVLAEYIWIDGSNGLRNKTKVSRVPNAFTLIPPPVARTATSITDRVFYPSPHLSVGRSATSPQVHPTPHCACAKQPADSIRPHQFAS